MSKCESTIEFGDDHADNVTTFHCQLDEDHEGKHVERGDLYGQPYTVEWEGGFIMENPT